MFRFLFAAVALIVPVSCAFVDSVLSSGEGEEAARVGKAVLYESEVARIVPPGLEGRDSALMAERIIDKWRLEQLLLEKAESELPSSEKDVSAELEAYRKSLLIYRYERMYVESRLDTAVTAMDIEEYYRENGTFFRTSSMLVRGYFVKINSDSPNLPQLRHTMGNMASGNVPETESLSAKVSYGYRNFYDYWMPLSDFVQDFGTDINTLERMASSSDMIEYSNDGMTVILRIWDRIPKGEIAPLDFCENAVRERILNVRKKELLDNLERDLLMGSA